MWSGIGKGVVLTAKPARLVGVVGLLSARPDRLLCVSCVGLFLTTKSARLLVVVEGGSPELPGGCSGGCVFCAMVF